jgi:hypothetical protein
MLTSALLMALAPAPLTPDATNSLFAIDAPASMEAVFQTRAPASSGWTCIYVHHSKSAASDSPSLVGPGGELDDHFVIGNGNGLADGEIQLGQRWDRQRPAAAPVSGTRIDPTCISICVVGDFDQNRPTPLQIRRLSRLVSTLQARYRIQLGNVVLADQPQSIAGIGRFFPVSAFREQLIP